MEIFLIVLLVLDLIMTETYCQSADNRLQVRSVVSILERFEEGIVIQEYEEEEEENQSVCFNNISN